jgi:chromosome segregation ATPase
MVFGWGKKKAQKQEPEPITPKEESISLSDIPQITDKIISAKKNSIISEVKTHRGNIQTELDSIKTIIHELEKDDLKVDEIDKHLRILVVRGKEAVISTIKQETKENLPEISSYDDVLELNSMLSQMLKRIGDVLGRQSRVIHIFAKKYASKLKEHLAALTSTQAALQALINNHTKLIDDVNQILDKKRQYHDSNQSLNNSLKRISELETDITQLNKSIQDAENMIQKLKSSEKYNKYLEAKQKFDSFLNEKNSIKNEIDLQFTKISRPLSKYGYISSLEKPQKVLMEHLISEPFDVINQSNKDDIITILSSVRKGVEAGTVSVKDSDKSLVSIDETIERLDDFISKTSEFNSKKEILEKELSIFDTNELKKEEEFILKQKENRNDTKQKIEMLQKENNDITNNLPKILADIEANLSKISSTKYRVAA